MDDTVGRDGNEIMARLSKTLREVFRPGSFIEFVSSNYLTTGSLCGRNREDCTLSAAQYLFGCASAQRIDKAPMALGCDYREIGTPPALGGEDFVDNMTCLTVISIDHPD